MAYDYDRRVTASMRETMFTTGTITSTTVLKALMQDPSIRKILGEGPWTVHFDKPARGGIVAFEVYGASPNVGLFGDVHAEYTTHGEMSAGFKLVLRYKIGF